MKHRSLILAGLLQALAVTTLLASTPAAAQATRPPQAAQAQAWSPAASVPALQARMKAIREATDPARRMALMDEQIQALEAATQAQSAPCPMGGPMMGGRGPGPGAGMMMDPNLMREHMELMQRHMEMMQRMMNLPAAPARPAQ